jgi:hypothetical protein
MAVKLCRKIVRETFRAEDGRVLKGRGLERGNEREGLESKLVKTYS